MTLFDRVFSGNDAVYGLTEGAIDAAIAQHGEDKAVSFPDTAYSLPCYYSVTGTKVTTLKELKEALGVVKTLMTREKRLNDAFMSGIATALCAEFIEVLKYIDGATPYEEPCYGHLADAVIRELGVPLVTGDIPGVAVILGTAPSVEEGVALVKSYQAQGILVTLVGGIIDQVKEAGMNTGANVRVIPLGKDVTAVIHVVSVALRAALIFGNVTPGDAGTLMKYTMDRVPAFVNAFGPLDDVVVACGAGAIALGFPVITNETENIFRVPKSLIVQEDVSKFNATSLEARDIKIKITNIDIPVAFASAFEGEIIRRKDMRVEFDGSRVDCAELVHTCDASEIEDHKITVVGPEVDEMEEGSKNSIAYVVKVAGKNMQPDFEPVIERKFHNYINCIEGVYHTGQRDMQRIRISHAAFDAGFRIKHIGEVLYTQVKNEFDAVVDKCEVVIYTDPAECTRIRHEVAIPTFEKRDDRLAARTQRKIAAVRKRIRGHHHRNNVNQLSGDLAHMRLGIIDVWNSGRKKRQKRGHNQVGTDRQRHQPPRAVFRPLDIVRAKRLPHHDRHGVAHGQEDDLKEVAHRRGDVAGGHNVKPAHGIALKQHRHAG